MRRCHGDVASPLLSSWSGVFLASLKRKSVTRCFTPLPPALPLLPSPPIPTPSLVLSPPIPFHHYLSLPRSPPSLSYFMYIYFFLICGIRRLLKQVASVSAFPCSFSSSSSLLFSFLFFSSLLLSFLFFSSPLLPSVKCRSQDLEEFISASQVSRVMTAVKKVYCCVFCYRNAYLGIVNTNKHSI